MTKMALDGVRVVEFGQLIAIPFATKLLADMGAEVVRIESCTRLDGYRVAGFYKNDASGEFWNQGGQLLRAEPQQEEPHPRPRPGARP